MINKTMSSSLRAFQVLIISRRCWLEIGFGRSSLSLISFLCLLITNDVLVEFNNRQIVEIFFVVS